MVDVNLLAVVVATLSSFVVGAVWYSKPFFGKAWMKKVGLSEKQAQEGMSKAMGKTTIASLIMAYVLANAIVFSDNYFAEYDFMTAALTTGLSLGIGISATTIVTQDAFEQRDLKLSLINAGNQIVTLVVMGLVIGLFGPA